MTYDEIVTMLEESGLPTAYDHFAEGESPDPFREATMFSRTTWSGRKSMN